MSTAAHQLDLFRSESLNITYDIKRIIRLELDDAKKRGLSRDEIVDSMNEIAVREGMRLGKNGISKDTLDGWCKDSDPGRLPSLPWLVIFCKILGTVNPIDILGRPLGSRTIGPVDAKKLAWADAELKKKRATRTARLALEAIDG